MLELEQASVFASLAERQLASALDGDLATLEEVAALIDDLGLPEEPVTDPAIRAELTRALTALRLCGEVLADRINDTGAQLRRASTASRAAAGYAAATGASSPR